MVRGVSVGQACFLKYLFRRAGNAISVYGLVGPDNGPYNVTLDGIRSVYNVSTQMVTPNALLVSTALVAYCS
jgi:hypothetical protein